MRDVTFVLITCGFFALAALYIRACARIVGDHDPVPVSDAASPDREQAVTR